MAVETESGRQISKELIGSVPIGSRVWGED